jgi:hypothetical protein
VRPGSLRPALQPQQIRRRAVRLAAVWASVRPGKQVAGRTGSEQIGRGHARVWPLVCLGFPLRFSIAAQVLDGKPLRKDGDVLRLRRRRGSTAPGRLVNKVYLHGFPRVAGLGGR